MLVADKWQDYELLDAGRGEKLERWGKIILQRPDPQAIWQADIWQDQDAVYHRSNKGGGEWEYKKRIPDKWQITYPGLCGTLRFHIEPGSFKHTGLFPEQASNWDFIASKVATAKAFGYSTKILNLFAYTGGATLAAAAGGAEETVHVDASKGMNQRAKENLALSDLDGRFVRFITDDVMKFTAREERRERRYMGIILDPPAYGRGPAGELWKLEDTLWPLLAQTIKLLDHDNPYSFLILNSYTSGLAAGVLENFLSLLLREPYGGVCHAVELGLRASRRALVLPCGSCGHWEQSSAGRPELS